MFLISNSSSSRLRFKIQRAVHVWMSGLASKACTSLNINPCVVGFWEAMNWYASLRLRMAEAIWGTAERHNAINAGCFTSFTASSISSPQWNHSSSSIFCPNASYVNRSSIAYYSCPKQNVAPNELSKSVLFAMLTRTDPSRVIAKFRCI